MIDASVGQEALRFGFALHAAVEPAARSEIDMSGIDGRFVLLFLKYGVSGLSKTPYLRNSRTPCEENSVVC